MDYRFFIFKGSIDQRGWGCQYPDNKPELTDFLFIIFKKEQLMTETDTEEVHIAVFYLFFFFRGGW